MASAQPITFGGMENGVEDTQPQQDTQPFLAYQMSDDEENPTAPLPPLFPTSSPSLVALFLQQQTTTTEQQGEESGEKKVGVHGKEIVVVMRSPRQLSYCLCSSFPPLSIDYPDQLKGVVSQLDHEQFMTEVNQKLVEEKADADLKTHVVFNKKWGWMIFGWILVYCVIYSLWLYSTHFLEPGVLSSLLLFGWIVSKVSFYLLFFGYCYFLQMAALAFGERVVEGVCGYVEEAGKTKFGTSGAHYCLFYEIVGIGGNWKWEITIT